MLNPFKEMTSVEIVTTDPTGHHSWTKENNTVLRFELHRDADVSGVSGTGVVADGVVWPDNSATIRWRGDRPSVVHWADVSHAESVHGHGGATQFVFLDV